MAQFEFTKDSEGKVIHVDEVEEALIDLKDLLKCRLYPDQAIALESLTYLFNQLPECDINNLTVKGWNRFISEFREVEEILDDCTVEITEEAYTRLEQLLAIQRVSDPSLTLETLFSRILLAIPMPVACEEKQ